MYKDKTQALSLMYKDEVHLLYLVYKDEAQVLYLVYKDEAQMLYLMYKDKAPNALSNAYNRMPIPTIGPHALYPYIQDSVIHVLYCILKTMWSIFDIVYSTFIHIYFMIYTIQYLLSGLYTFYTYIQDSVIHALYCILETMCSMFDIMYSTLIHIYSMIYNIQYLLSGLYKFYTYIQDSVIHARCTDSVCPVLYTPIFNIIFSILYDVFPRPCILYSI